MARRTQRRPVEFSRLNLRSLQYEMQGQPRHRDQIIRQHARQNADGYVVRCTPGPNDDQGNTPSIGKVVYNTRRDAERCAEKVNRLGGRIRPQRAYECTRDDYAPSHWHLTSRSYLDGEVFE